MLVNRPQGGNRRVAMRQVRQALAFIGDNMAAASGILAAPGEKRLRSSIKAPGKRSSSRRSSKGAAIVKNARSGVTRRAGKRGSSSRRKKSLRARVATLEKTKPKLAVLDYRNLNATYAISAENQCAYKTLFGIDAATLEAATDAVQYIDRGGPPAPDLINLNDMSYKHDMDFRNLFHEVSMRNNKETTIHVDTYTYIVTDQSSSSVTDWMTTDETSLGLSGMITDPNCYPSDSPSVKTHFKLIKHNKFVLNPGDEAKVTYSRKRRLYDPKERDNNGSVTYQKGDQIVIIRTVGGISHGFSDETKVGFASTHLDIITKRKFKYYYTGDAPFKLIETVQSLDVQTGGDEQAGPTVDPALQ